MTNLQTHRLFSVSNAPIRYLVIPKCGCTFVKNILWKIENGRAYHSPLRIHDADQKFLRARDLNLTAADIRREEFAFTVIRNPVDRFFSLYSDKIIGDGHKNFVPLRKLLADRYGLNSSAVNISQHRKNCEILVEWLQRNLTSSVDIKKESHWTPQSYRKNLFGIFNLKMLLVDDLTNQISFLLREIVGDIDQLAETAEPNRSKKEYKKQEILDPLLRKRINEVYSSDRKLFNSVRKEWSKIDLTLASNTDIPRYSAKWLPD